MHLLDDGGQAATAAGERVLRGQELGAGEDLCANQPLTTSDGVQTRRDNLIYALARTLSRMPEKWPAGTMTGNVPAGDDGGTGRGDWTCSA